jgi:prophage regulatory protein
MPKLLSFPELRQHGVLVGRRQVDRLEAEGKFPKRVLLGVHRVGWVTAEIDEFVDQAIGRRSSEIGKLGSHPAAAAD